MSDTPGKVVDITTGRQFGKTASLEKTFVDAAKEAVERDGRDSVYVVVGPDSSEDFRARLVEICPVVVDQDAKGVALILSGKPSEWKTLHAS